MIKGDTQKIWAVDCSPTSQRESQRHDLSGSSEQQCQSQRFGDVEVNSLRACLFSWRYKGIYWFTLTICQKKVFAGNEKVSRSIHFIQPNKSQRTYLLTTMPLMAQSQISIVFQETGARRKLTMLGCFLVVLQATLDRDLSKIETKICFHLDGQHLNFFKVNKD